MKMVLDCGRFLYRHPNYVPGDAARLMDQIRMERRIHFSDNREYVVLALWEEVVRRWQKEHGK